MSAVCSRNSYFGVLLMLVPLEEVAQCLFNVFCFYLKIVAAFAIVAAVSFAVASASFMLIMPAGLWIYRVGIEIVPLGMPCFVREMRAASVVPIRPDSSCMGIFSCSAVSRSSRRIFGWVISPESETVIVGPFVSFVVVSNSLTPGTSPAIVTSIAIARSGSTPNAAVAAPLNPTSSWTVPTAQIVQGGFWSCFRVSIRIAHPILSSNALPMTRSWFSCWYFVLNAIGSPIFTPSSVVCSLFSAPMSMKSSSYVWIFLRSSSFCMWGGLVPITPVIWPFSVKIVTVCAVRIRSSIPPTFVNWTNPSLLIVLTISPTSSM